MIKPKKHLGQHFLIDSTIARRIVSALEEATSGTTLRPNRRILEIGPGTGALTKFLLDKYGENYWAIEIDEDACKYLIKEYPTLVDKIIRGDVLKFHFKDFIVNEESISLIGNFPYNISTQVVFKILENHAYIKTVIGMFQKEVAKRICSLPGNKEYGIPSVLTQAYYHVTYLFDVPPIAFSPPPKVQSGVIWLERRNNFMLGCDTISFRKVVKAAFNQRRKKLRNALAGMVGNKKMEGPEWHLRAEQLSLEDFVKITNMLNER